MTQHFISVNQVTSKFWNEILELSNKFSIDYKFPGNFNLPLTGYSLTNLFYEASTRTSSSFYAAMTKLGGSVIPINGVQFSSVSKGETLEDTVRTVGCYSDIIALRHPQIGSAALASRYSPVPIINAGDGAGEHPTQALLDLYTIVKYFPNPESIQIGFMGDLKYGRTIHSLVTLLKKIYPKIDIHYISPPGLEIPYELNFDSFSYNKLTNELIKNLDVLYVTRVQKERMTNLESIPSYFISLEEVENMKSNSIILHPLPRTNELPEEIDLSSKAKYFEQMKNGLWVRMALLYKILKE